MSDTLKPALHGREHCPGGEDPIPCLAMDPWIVIEDGSTTSPADGSWMPIPFTGLFYDPALVTQGVVFDWEILDTDDPGNDRFQLRSVVEGIYEYELLTSWNQVTTDGANDHGYAVQELRPFNSAGTVIAGISTFNENIVTSADWPKNAATSDHEMLDNPYLRSHGIAFLPGNNKWKPRAKQTTGSARGLSGIYFKLIYRGALGDSADWTFELV